MLFKRCGSFFFFEKTQTSMFLSFFAVTAIFFDGFYKSSNFYLPNLFTKKRLCIFISYKRSNRSFWNWNTIGFFFLFLLFLFVLTGGIKRENWLNCTTRENIIEENRRAKKKKKKKKCSNEQNGESIEI